MPLRRKKWSEEEEEALICKYGELQRSGFLSRTKSRERKFEPVAAHVNALFHSHNPVAFPWLWTWKDASTKVQNMRHQYLGVKAKIRKFSGDIEAFDWEDGLSQWSNFLKYKEIFGDQELDVNDFLAPPPSSSSSAPPRNHLMLPLSQQQQQHHQLHSAIAHHGAGMHLVSKDMINSVGIGIADHSGSLLLPPVKDAPASIVVQGVLDGQNDDLANSLHFEYDQAAGDSLKDTDVNYVDDDDGNALAYSRLKRARRCVKLECNLDVGADDCKLLALMTSHYRELHGRVARQDERVMEREREWEKRHALVEAELARQRLDMEQERSEILEMWRKEADRRDAEKQEWKLKRMEAECKRKEAERERDRARDEMLEREKMKWREKMETQSMQHQADMMQVLLQIAQNQQNVLALVSGAFFKIGGHGNDFSTEGGSSSSLVSQLLHNLQTQGNAMAPCSVRRAANESSDSQFDTD